MPELTWVQADLLAPSVVDALAAHLPDPTAVVHAAGTLISGRLGALDHQALDTMWRLHVDVPSRLVNALVPRLADDGRIVLIGSRTSVGVAGKSQYAATKAAQEALSRSWAAELAPRRVTVNVVAPGPTRTAMLEDPARAATPPQVPRLGRFVEPAEVADLVGSAREAGLRVEGLMTIGPTTGGPGAARPGFRLVRRLVDDLGLARCSMGMSDDLEVAAAEGSTEVRVGTALFGARAAR
jgi:NAD(P)-dependent dehydrogenase (short-subunit alcohol dehydrogenase family)